MRRYDQWDLRRLPHPRVLPSGAEFEPGKQTPGAQLSTSCRPEEEVHGHLRTSPTVSHWVGQ